MAKRTRAEPGAVVYKGVRRLAGALHIVTVHKLGGSYVIKVRHTRPLA